MEASLHKDHQSPQKSLYLSEGIGELPPGISHTNSDITGLANVSRNNRFLYHSFSYPPAIGKPPIEHDRPGVQTTSYLQRATNLSTSETIASSPELRPDTSLQSSPLSSSRSSFPLPYRPRSAIHHRSSSAEYPLSNTSALTSQDIWPPQLPSTTQGSPIPFSSPQNFQQSQSGADVSEPRLHSEHSPSLDRYSRGLHWPQSRSRGNREHQSRSWRYDASASPRSTASRKASLHLLAKHRIPQRRSWKHTANPQSGLKQEQFLSSVKELLPGFEPNDKSGPQLLRYALPARLEDAETTEDATVENASLSISRYIFLDDEDQSVKSIRSSPYWTGLKDDPIFHDLSGDKGTVSIADLRQRRDHLLHNHILQSPRQAIVMKEQGTQTDPEASRSSQRTNQSGLNHPERISEEPHRYDGPEDLQARPQSVPHSRRRHHAMYRKQQNRTPSLTDTESPATPRRQYVDEKARGFKRARGVTDDEYEGVDFAHRRRLEESTSLNSFYSRRR